MTSHKVDEENAALETALAHPLPTDERTLARRAQAGDLEAFGELVSRYMRRAYSRGRPLSVKNQRTAIV